MFGNYIGDEGAEDLAQGLKHNTVFIQNLFEDVFSYFLTLQTLITLNIGENLIGKQGAEHLLRQLQNNTVIFLFAKLLHYVLFSSTRH